MHGAAPLGPACLPLPAGTLAQVAVRCCGVLWGRGSALGRAPRCRPPRRMVQFAEQSSTAGLRALHLNVSGAVAQGLLLAFSPAEVRAHHVLPCPPPRCACGSPAWQNAHGQG